jgi:hypothetical protein
VFSDLRTLNRFGRGLRRLLDRPMPTAECHEHIRTELGKREENFIHLVQHGIYGSPVSPYRKLLDHAGVEYGDVVRLVREHGTEGALDVLHDEGVHVTHEEFRGHTPIKRGSLELDYYFGDAANPLVEGVYAAESGGSRGPGRITLVNFDSLHQQVAHYRAFLSAFGLVDRPAAVWYPPPPTLSGLNTAISQAMAGRPAEHWFIQTPLWRRQLDSLKPAGLTVVAWRAGRASGRHIPFPRHVPPGRVAEVATWLAEKRAVGAPGLLAANPSASARVCAAADELGLDISGSFFRMAGEPFTPAKARMLEAAGAAGACHYFLGEAGGLAGLACADPIALGDVHVCTDRLAILQRPRGLPGGEIVGALYLTTVIPSARTLVINLETDDFGVLEERPCGCELGTLGLGLHLHTIRSFEKLTGEGATFVGEPLISLVEEVLPGRFGGSPVDYQLVEHEASGVTRVQVRISPSVGDIAEREVVDVALAYLAASSGGGQVMARLWTAGETLEVVRIEPEETRTGKVLPLALAKSVQPSEASVQ